MNLIHPLGRKEVEKGGIDLGSKVSLSLSLFVSIGQFNLIQPCFFSILWIYPSC